MYARNSTPSYKLWNFHSHNHQRLQPHHFSGIRSVKQGNLSANHGLFLFKKKSANNMRFNVGNEIHQLASSGFGPPQGSNSLWDAFFTILLPFVQAIFCWGPSQILKQLGGLNPVDKGVETAEMGAEIVKDVANKVGDTAVETAEMGSKIVEDVANKVGDRAVGTVDLGTGVVKNVAGKVEDRAEKSVELGTGVVKIVVGKAEDRAGSTVEVGTKVVKNVAGKVEDVAERSVESETKVVKIVAGNVEDRTGQTVEVGIEVVEDAVESVDAVADDIVEKLPVDEKLDDTVKGVEDLAKGATKDIRKIFGRGLIIGRDI